MAEWDARALAVLDALRRGGHRAVLVGGCVRDTLLGRPLHDYDAATSALPGEIAAACAPMPCIPTGEKHGTYTVLSDGLAVEVTTFRREADYSDHRRPDRVDFTASLEEDLARRDFTINAMAWDEGGLVDLFGGQNDLAAGVIRCVGNPEQRFREDALRILRGLRLAAQLEFSLEPGTMAALKSLSPLLSWVSRERIGGELVRLLCSPGAGAVLLAAPEVIVQVLPQLEPTVGFQQCNPHHIYDVYTHSVTALTAVPPQPPLRLAALLHDIGKPSTFFTDKNGTGHFYGHDRAGVPLAQAAVDSLRLPRALSDRVVELVRLHHLPLGPDRSMVGRRLARLGPELFFQLLALQQADSAACAPGQPAPPFDDTEAMARALLAQAPCLTVRDLAVNGRDALAAGLRGPAIGQRLSALLDRVAAGELDNRREVLLPLLSLPDTPNN